MKKKERHELLKQLIEDKAIHRQEDFVRILKERGIEVTQATISRDIKEMQLMKVPAPLGGYQYTLPPSINRESSSKLARMMKDSFVSIDSQNEFLLIKTVPGNAVALGSLIENVQFDEVFGIVSGDDTILIICRGAEQAGQLQNKMIRYI